MIRSCFGGVSVVFLVSRWFVGGDLFVAWWFLGGNCSYLESFFVVFLWFVGSYLSVFRCFLFVS